jgi:hypothetical protein
MFADQVDCEARKRGKMAALDGSKEGTMGLKRHAWRNAARSALVAAERMALAAVSLEGRLGGIL